MTKQEFIDKMERWSTACIKAGMGLSNSDEAISLKTELLEELDRMARYKQLYDDLLKRHREDCVAR